MRNILVTGGAGFIGSNLVGELVKDPNNQVYILDNESTGDFANIRRYYDRPNIVGEYSLGKLDIMSDVDLNYVFGLTEFDTVFHLAAIPSVPKSLKDPLASHNASATATLRMLEWSKRNGVKNFIYSASSSAYGDHEHYPQVETMLGVPKSPYAIGKYAGELYCRAYANMTDMKIVALRYFNVFGPGQKADSPYSAVIPKFIRIMKAGGRPNINGDGSVTRDFTYVSNAVQANILAMQAPPIASGEVFNVGAGGRTSLVELVDKINNILGTDIEPTFGPALDGEVHDSFADISKAYKFLGYVPKVSIDEGLIRLINND